MSAQIFNVATFFYVSAMFLYLVYIIVRKDTLSKFALLMTSAGWLMHTTALIFRWNQAGLEHPPWSNLYESIVFFIWGMVLVYQVMQYRFSVPLAGSFVLPFVVIGLGIAAFGTDKEISPLVPALRSKWIFIHVFMACIAYPSFLIGSVFALLYLMKDRVRMEYFGSAVSGLAALVLLFTVGYDVFFYKTLHLIKVAIVDGKEVLVQYFPSPGAPLLREYVSIPYVSELFLACAAAYVFTFLMYQLSLRREKKEFYEMASYFLFGTCILHALTLGGLLYYLYQSPDVSFRSAPFKIGMILLSWAMVGLFGIFNRNSEKIISALPSADLLDRLSFKANLFGLPMVTLLLVTGGIWAYSAWGRFWGWDPKETWALITWFTYAIYVHSRIVSGWSGRKPAVISIIGFFVVMFTYLGVNILLSGLHSYGNPNPQQ